MITKTGQGIEDILGGKREEILRLAAQQGVYNVRVFGSVARGEAAPESHVDFLVDGLENAAWGGSRLLMELQELLGRQVDLVSEKDLHRLIRDRICAEAVPLSGQSLFAAEGSNPRLQNTWPPAEGAALIESFVTTPLVGRQVSRSWRFEPAAA